jgi:hypothetical protein
VLVSSVATAISMSFETLHHPVEPGFDAISWAGRIREQT